jgi:hypothetical protein
MTDADRRWPQPDDIARQRAADTDRDAVAERLRVAAREGRIELWELDVGPEPDALVLRTTTPNIRQEGRWIVPRLITAESTTGWITIDFTQASCAYREVTVEVVTRTGWIQLILPDGWAARVGPLSTYTGHISNKATEIPDPGAPTVVVTGHPLFGYIKIRQRHRRR